MNTKNTNGTKPKYDVVIIGSGVSGMAAAIYCGRFQLKTVVIGDKPGGTLVLTNDIANYPGFKQISGLELTDKIREHADDYKTEFVDEKVLRIKSCSEGCFRVYTHDKEFHTKTIIYSTGTEWRKLNVPGESEFTGKGVHYCALCDGPFYKNKIIGVVGGSDSAAKEALLLTEYAKKVYMIYRGKKIRPEPINYERVMNNKKIEIINDTNVKEVKGDKFVRIVILDKPYDGSEEFKLDGLFIEIGHLPISELAKDLGVKLNKKNEIMIDRESKTNLKGFFAAGDVCDTIFKQAITGVAEGVHAAYSAYEYISNNEIIRLSNDEEPQGGKKHS